MNWKVLWILELMFFSSLETVLCDVRQLQTSGGLLHNLGALVLHYNNKGNCPRNYNPLLKDAVCATAIIFKIWNVKREAELWEWCATHHTIGEGVTSLRHRQALDHLGGHPGKRAHQGHVCCVGQELRRPEITDLTRWKQNQDPCATKSTCSFRCP